MDKYQEDLGLYSPGDLGGLSPWRFNQSEEVFQGDKEDEWDKYVDKYLEPTVQDQGDKTMEYVSEEVSGVQDQPMGEARVQEQESGVQEQMEDNPMNDSASASGPITCRRGII